MESFSRSRMVEDIIRITEENGWNHSDGYESQDEGCSHVTALENTIVGGFWKHLAPIPLCSPLSLWDRSPCRSRALPLWSVSIFLTDEFAHYICEAICDSVGTAPVSYPLQCVVLLLADRSIRLLSLILTCHQFDWTIARPLETGVAWLKTMDYSDLYWIQIFP